MLIIPAIDLKDGKVVRLFQGKDDEKVYSRNPVVVARHWQKEGAEIIHIVDLDGAFTGEPKHLGLVKKIINAIEVPVEFGGGLRTKEMIGHALSIGVTRVIIGTKAAEDKVFLKEAYEEFGDRLIVSIDAKNGIVMTQGWQSENSQKLEASVFAGQIKELGFTEVIYTDTAKDGTLRGPNIEGIKKFIDKTSLKTIASGGVSSIDDLIALRELEPNGVIGAIVGKALYEQRFSLKEALKALE
jgi:phosphoribosylformimino-5-aminoimidazole carboxamide ribotide isomerase